MNNWGQPTAQKNLPTGHGNFRRMVDPHVMLGLFRNGCSFETIFTQDLLALR